jgi:hypothetical protein
MVFIVKRLQQRDLDHVDIVSFTVIAIAVNVEMLRRHFFQGVAKTPHLQYPATYHRVETLE